MGCSRLVSCWGVAGLDVWQPYGLAAVWLVAANGLHVGQSGGSWQPMGCMYGSRVARGSQWTACMAVRWLVAANGLHVWQSGGSWQPPQVRGSQWAACMAVRWLVAANGLHVWQTLHSNATYADHIFEIFLAGQFNSLITWSARKASAVNFIW